MVRHDKQREMAATSMNIRFENKYLGVNFYLTTVLFLPEWIGKFVCKRKDHSWEIWGDVCDRCGLVGVENE